MYRLHLSLPYIAFIKAVYNESNERCNALQVYPRPLYASAAVNIRPLPNFYWKIVSFLLFHFPNMHLS